MLDLMAHIFFASNETHWKAQDVLVFMKMISQFHILEIL